MLGSPRGRPAPPPDPNAYYEWRGHSTAPGTGRYGSAIVTDLNGDVTRGGYPLDQTLPFKNPPPGPEHFWEHQWKPNMAPDGIWQQTPSFAPFRDLETARRFQQERAYKDWERLPKANQSYGNQAPSYPTNPNWKWGTVDRKELTKEDRLRTVYEVDLKNRLLSRIFGTNGQGQNQNRQSSGSAPDWYRLSPDKGPAPTPEAGEDNRRSRINRKMT